MAIISTDFHLLLSYSTETFHRVECSDAKERLQQCAPVQVSFVLTFIIIRSHITQSASICSEN